MSGSVLSIGADAEGEAVVEDDWADKPELVSLTGRSELG